MLEVLPENCSACRQTLWSAVPYCPFCGEQAASAGAAQDAQAAGDDAAGLADDTVIEAADSGAAQMPAPAQLAQAARKRKPAARPKPGAAPASEKPRKPVVAQLPVHEPALENKTALGAAAAGADVSAPAAKAQTGRRSGLSRKSWWAAAVACGLVYWLWDAGPPPPDACDQSLAQAQSSLQQENAPLAREHSQAALAACKDKARAHLAKTADEGAQALLKTQAQAQARAEQQSRRLAQQQARQQAACESANRQTASLLQSARLHSASKQLERVDDACRQTAETQALLAQLSGMQATANKATADASAQLADGAFGQARTSIEVLASVNRESAELNELRAALNKAQAAANPPPPAPAPAAQTELLRSFIRDAETAMQQRLYDKAKTLAESAQRIDPRNAEVTRLLRRIKEHEMSYLRERIVID